MKRSPIHIRPKWQVLVLANGNPRAPLGRTEKARPLKIMSPDQKIYCQPDVVGTQKKKVHQIFRSLAPPIYWTSAILASSGAYGQLDISTCCIRTTGYLCKHGAAIGQSLNDRKRGSMVPYNQSLFIHRMLCLSFQLS